MRGTTSSPSHQTLFPSSPINSPVMLHGSNLKYFHLFPDSENMIYYNEHLDLYGLPVPVINESNSSLILTEPGYSSGHLFAGQHHDHTLQFVSNPVAPPGQQVALSSAAWHYDRGYTPSTHGLHMARHCIYSQSLERSISSSPTNELLLSYEPTSAPHTWIDTRDSLSPVSITSIDGGSSTASPTSSPRPHARSSGSVDTSSRCPRQGIAAGTASAKSKVAQYSRDVVLDALTRRPLLERKASKDPPWDGKLACELCGKVYKSKSLQRHLESHGRQSSRPAWICCGVPDGKGGREHGCGSSFYHRRDALARHIRQTGCLGDPKEIQMHIHKARMEKREVFSRVW